MVICSIQQYQLYCKWCRAIKIYDNCKSAYALGGSNSLRLFYQFPFRWNLYHDLLSHQLLFRNVLHDCILHFLKKMEGCIGGRINIIQKIFIFIRQRSLICCTIIWYNKSGFFYNRCFLQKGVVCEEEYEMYFGNDNYGYAYLATYLILIGLYHLEETKIFTLFAGNQFFCIHSATDHR